MKSFAATIVLAIATLTLAAPAEKRVETTAITLCKQVGCAGPASDRISLTVNLVDEAKECHDVPANFNEQIIAVQIANPAAYCSLRLDSCAEVSGGVIAQGNVNDLNEFPTLGKGTSSLACFGKYWE